MINNFKFIHFLTTALIVELFMLYLFRFTKSPFTGESINNWYTNFKWSAIILDVASVIIGFYLARYLYNYLVSINFIDKKNVQLIKPKGRSFDKKLKVDSFVYEINGKVKLIHLLLEDDIDPNRQNKSIESLQNLKKFGIEYVQIWNKRWTKTPPKETFTRPNEFDKIPITPGHYGAFRAFADGTINHFTKDDDHFIICEGDALLMVSPAQVVDKINLAISSIKEYDISYFSFGSRYTLEDNILQSKTREQYGEIHIVNNIIGIQMIMFPQRIREYLIDRFIYATWDGADIFLTNIFVNKFKMGILEEPISSQVSGLSAIEGQHRKFIENN